jgi:hypothetical protein
MRPAANAGNAVSENPPTREPLQPSLRFTEQTHEPATEGQLTSLMRLGYQPVRPLTKERAAHLIRGLEENPPREQASAENGVREITKLQAHLLQQAVEEAGRAVREATPDQVEELDRILFLAMAERRDFWIDTCREPPQTREPSVQGLDLHMRYGCRLVVPSAEQVQKTLHALDLLMPLWDRQHPELFHQTLELNFPELDRNFVGRLV